METSLPRLRRFAVSAQTFRRVALANAVMLVVIVATGATVRLTGSGLGCEHWPGCTAGDPLPVRGGDSVFIPGDEKHQFRNAGAVPLRFICVIPLQNPCDV